MKNKLPNTIIERQISVRFPNTNITEKEIHIIYNTYGIYLIKD